MMDIVILLLFMVIFYLGPALLKSYNAKIKAQPAVPEQLNYEMMNAAKNNKPVPVYVVSNTELHTAMEVDKVHIIPTIAEEKSAWKGKLDQNMIINGVIFAEILLPPRAYRPFIKR